MDFTGLSQRIERAFAEWQMPACTVDAKQLEQFSSDVEDALWFSGRERYELTWEEWTKRGWGFGFFSAEAVVYYLPSLMILSIGRPDGWLYAVDTVVHWLDLSPDMQGVDSYLIEHFSLFDAKEFEAVKEWLLCLSDFKGMYGVRADGAGDSLGRAYEALHYVEQRVAKLAG